MKLAVVVQRYGLGVNGGAELHARYVAERLARHATVEVMTTCALDYVSWRNELHKGTEEVNGIQVRRFRVSHERDPRRFSRKSELVFGSDHSVGDELGWLTVEGPASPALVSYVSRHIADFDYWIFFSYRYYHAFHGARAAAGRAILVPTAERDSALGLSIFKPVFRGVRAIMYNSPEERAMIQALSENHSVPSVVVGVGSDVPHDPQPRRFRQKFKIQGPFAIYVGRIDENKGCRELFEAFRTYRESGAGQLTLVLVGNSLMTIPDTPHIRHLGFLNDTDKFDAMAAAEVLIMPSYFESLSMVALEAWALSRPVLANAKCDVLKGQCIRSDAGLYYANPWEFVEALRAIEQNRWLSAGLGRNGRRFFRDHYDWPVVEGKYLDMFRRLSAEPPHASMDPLPGWLRRRRADCRPATEVVAALPAGPILDYVPEPPSALVSEEQSRPARPNRAAGRPQRKRPARPPRRNTRPPSRRRGA